MVLVYCLIKNPEKMNYKDRNRFYMFKRIEAVFNQHETALAKQTRLVELAQEFRSKVTALEDLLVNQGKLKQSWSDYRDRELEELTDAILLLQHSVRDAALEADDKLFLERPALTRNDILRTSAQKAATVVKELMEVAEQYAEQIKTYANGENLLEFCRERVNNLVAKVHSPKLRRKQLKEVGRNIAAAHNELSEMLNVRVDGLVAMLVVEEPEFVYRYKENRIIPKIGNGRPATTSNTSVDPEVILPPTPPVGELGGGDLPGLPGGDAPPGDDDGGEG